MDKWKILEEEKKTIEGFLEKNFNPNVDLNTVEFELKRFNNALVQENERNRKDAFHRLKMALADTPKNVKRGPTLGETPKGVPLPPRVREFINETIHNIQSRLPDETELAANNPKSLPDENAKRDKNN